MKKVEQPNAGFGPLVETGWLASELGAPDLRVITPALSQHPPPGLVALG